MLIQVTEESIKGKVHSSPISKLYSTANITSIRELDGKAIITIDGPNSFEERVVSEDLATVLMAYNSANIVDVAFQLTVKDNNGPNYAAVFNTDRIIEVFPSPADPVNDSEVRYFNDDRGINSIVDEDLTAVLAAAIMAAGGGTTFQYTNSDPMPQAVGGYDAGTTFNMVSNEDMWTGLLYPYQEPVFSSFVISGQATTLEVGDSVAGGIRTFNWGTTNPANIQANSLIIRDITGGGDLATGLADDSTEDVNIGAAKQLVLPGLYRWQIEGTNTELNTFTRNFDVNWRFRIFYGNDGAGPLTEAQVEALDTNQLAAGFAGTFSFPATDYKWFCYPDSFGTATSFIDQGTGFPVAMEPHITVNLTNAFGVAEDYKCHRTTNQLGSAITIIIS